MRNPTLPLLAYGMRMALMATLLPRTRRLHVMLGTAILSRSARDPIRSGVWH